MQLGWIEVPEAAIAFAIEPKAKGDEEKIGEALHRLMDEDPALHSGRDPSRPASSWSPAPASSTSRSRSPSSSSRYHVEVILHPPKVPYRETILKPADGHGRHKKQTGGRGQFADCTDQDRAAAARRATSSSSTRSSAAPSRRTTGRRSRKGIQEARLRGYLAGYPVVDFRVRLLDGQYHDVDSSELAFKIAGSLAFKDAMANATPDHPRADHEGRDRTPPTSSWATSWATSPSAAAARRAWTSKNGGQIVAAVVPMSEMLDYAPALRSMTQGRAELPHGVLALRRSAAAGAGQDHRRGGEAQAGRERRALTRPRRLVAHPEPHKNERGRHLRLPHCCLPPGQPL